MGQLWTRGGIAVRHRGSMHSLVDLRICLHMVVLVEDKGDKFIPGFLSCALSNNKLCLHRLRVWRLDFSGITTPKTQSTAAFVGICDTPQNGLYSGNSIAADSFRQCALPFLFPTDSFPPTSYLDCLMIKLWRRVFPGSPTRSTLNWLNTTNETKRHRDGYSSLPLIRQIFWYMPTLHRSSGSHSLTAVW